MLKFKPKAKKIYKFVYEHISGNSFSRKTHLVTACDPVQAVKTFNRTVKTESFDLIEFTEVDL